MKDFYRNTQVEEGGSNLILHNRCGNRLTLSFHEQTAALEWLSRLLEVQAGDAGLIYEFFSALPSQVRVKNLAREKRFGS